jgi:hypothetical protein
MACRKRRVMNADGQRRVALDFRQRVAAGQYRKEAERARQTATQAVSARDRAYWSALAANWEKLAKEAEAPKIKPWG